MVASLKQELREPRSDQVGDPPVRHCQRSAGLDHMPLVIDGAFDLFYELFGPKFGRHACSAVGLAELPHGIPVETQRGVRAQHMTRERDRQAAAAYITPEIVRQTILEMIDIRSPTGSEAAMADYVVHRLRGAGIAASLQLVEDNRP